jgi:ATP-dependent protease Clp ATPase subunit
VSRSAGLLTCSFCGNSQKQVKKLIVGPHARICDGCVSRAHAVLADPGQPAGPPIATIQRVADDAAAEQCGFCQKRRDQVAAMASAGGTAVICDECLDLCDEIVTDEPPKRR